MKKLKKILLVLLIVIVTGCSLSQSQLTTDYYTYINKDKIDEYVLEDDEFTISTFTEIQDEVDKQVDLVFKEKIATAENQNINILYNQLIDINTRNNNGLSTINYYLNLIDKSTNINDFINNAIIVENELFIPIFISKSIMSDFKDTSKNMLYLSPITFDFSAPSDYYIADDYLAQRALIKQYGIKLLKQYGYDKKQAREISKNITDYYTEIAKQSKPSEYFNDIENMYNIITKEELKKIYNKLPDSYFITVPDNIKLSILDSGNYIAINNSLTEENVETLKESVKLKILQSYCNYLTEDYAKIANDFENEQLGIEKDLDLEYNAQTVITNLFQYDIDELYASQYLDANSKKYILDMINDILNYYESNISNLTWLSPETKTKAINKVKNMTINIGLTETYPKYSANYNLTSDKTLIENILSIMKTISDYEYQSLLTNEKIPLMDQITVNAYYNPQDNSINFPAASVNFVDLEKTYYENLGTIGMIIAHEVTHAFDANGSKFDELGNLVNWWTDEDRSNYEKVQKEVIDYYNKYEVISGNYINGELTLSENIADLGAVSCISGIVKEKKASSQEIRSMYASFASLWAEKSREEYTKLLLLIDTHAPNKYRVNATLSSTDLFYEVYNVSKDNEMYIPEDERLRVW